MQHLRPPKRGLNLPHREGYSGADTINRMPPFLITLLEILRRIRRSGEVDYGDAGAAEADVLVVVAAYRGMGSEIFACGLAQGAGAGAVKYADSAD